MEIQVKDIEKLNEQADNLVQISTNIKNSQEDINSISQKISSSWQSDTVDKESYLKELNEGLKKIGTLAQALLALSQSLQRYASSQTGNMNR